MVQEIIGIFGDHVNLPTGMAVVLSNLALGLSHHGLRVIYFGRFGQKRGFSKEPVIHDEAMNYDLVDCCGGVWKPRVVVEAINHYEIDFVVSEDDFFSAGGLVKAIKHTRKPFHFITPIDSLPIHPRAFDIFKECTKVYVPNSSYKLIKNGVFLPHGCDVNMFYPESVPRDDIFTFVWVGRDEPRKALGRAIMALQLIYKEVECQMIIHSDWRAEQAKRTAEYLFYKKDLPIITSQMESGSQDQVRETYNKGDALICSSKAGAAEMSITEAAGCGLPALVTDHTFMNETVTSYRNGIRIKTSSTCGDTVTLWNGKRWGIPLGRIWGNISIKELAKVMKECVEENVGMVEKMGDMARKNVKENYNWIRIAGKLAEEMLYD